MPAASLLGGLAVPALALTLGWQWAYVAGAVLAGLTVATLLPAVNQLSAASQRLATAPRPDLSMGLLALYGLVRRWAHVCLRLGLAGAVQPVGGP